MPGDDQRQKNALLIAASLIAAVRTAREDSLRPSPRIISQVADSVHLARMVLQRIQDDPDGKQEAEYQQAKSRNDEARFGRR